MQRSLLLNGFMATGKSTVGRRVSAITGRPFIDLDAEIERSAGASVQDLFASRGEAGFRALESEALRRVLERSSPVVVALGGGALLKRAARLAALDAAVVVTLEATTEDVLARTRGSATRPLLATADPRARVEELLEARKIAYAECHARVSTTGRGVEDVAKEVIGVWKRDPIAVGAGAESYVVDIGRGIVDGLLGETVRGASSVLLVSDTNVAPLHAPRLEAALKSSGVRWSRVVLDAGEEHKHVGSLSRIWDAALQAESDRKTRFVALGGGVVSDVAGFAAATWMRGVPWVCLPTTLLSMVDASVGGKTAVDLKGAKNSVGAFWQPRRVLCDVEHLATEPDRGYRSAFAEVIKTALIGDPELLALCESHAAEAGRRDPEVLTDIVRRCIRVKARVVGLDEREDGLRATLNLGHTVGHAIEAFGGYGQLPHGEAISLGLVAALRIGERLGLTDRSLTERCSGVLSALSLPTDLKSQPLLEAAALIGHDKKRAGSKLKFIVARGVGQVEIVELPLTELREHVAAIA